MRCARRSWCACPSPTTSWTRTASPSRACAARRRTSRSAIRGSPSTRASGSRGSSLRSRRS
jgi:hypothetical protein